MLEDSSSRIWDITTGHLIPQIFWAPSPSQSSFTSLHWLRISHTPVCSYSLLWGISEESVDLCSRYALTRQQIRAPSLQLSLLPADQVQLLTPLLAHPVLQSTVTHFWACSGSSVSSQYHEPQTGHSAPVMKRGKGYPFLKCAVMLSRAQNEVSFPCCEDQLLILLNLLFTRAPYTCACQAAFQPLGPQPVLRNGVISVQM